MAIKIGNSNRINRTEIIDNSKIHKDSAKNNIISKHPILSTVILTLVTGLITGLILMFSFWKPFVECIEHVIGG